MSAPTFVVVGHVNRGKSSIVSTLAADDSVAIDARPGTTQQRREFPLVVGTETLYTLIDTPGFERPRQALAWLREHETTTDARRAVVQQFVRQHRDGNGFAQECELLEPILDGAAILYVVDGSKPPSPKYEAEMEILRWTAQPRVALINSIGSDDYMAHWKSVLDQYFNMVRTFNAHQADFADRIALLRMLREMSEQTRERIDRAIAVLQEDRRANLVEASSLIAKVLVASMTWVEQKRLLTDAKPEEYQQALTDRYYNKLRQLETDCHRRLKEIFQHRRLVVAESALEVVDDDLFNVETWNHLGLSHRQLIAAGTATGAATGGVIDAVVGGASFLTGMLIGGAVGGAASWYAARKLPEVRVLGIHLGGQRLQIGPMNNPGFPWVLLDRSLLLLDVLAKRAHARREQVNLGDGKARDGVVAELAGDQRKSIERSLAKLRRSPNPATTDGATAALAETLSDILTERYEQ